MSRRNNRRIGQASGNFNVQASLDVRDVATMAQFLIARGEITNEKYGKIISWCFDLGLNYLRQKYQRELTEFEQIEDAVHALDAMGYSIDQFKVGGNRRLLHAISQQSIDMDFGGTEFANYGLNKVTKNERPITAEPKTYSVYELETVAKQLHRESGYITPGYEYLFLAPVSMPDTSEVLSESGHKENQPSVAEQNWEGAKSMARLILDGYKTKASPECAPFLPLIDKAIESVLIDLNAARAEKEALEKVKLKAALLAGPTAVV